MQLFIIARANFAMVSTDGSAGLKEGRAGWPFEHGRMNGIA